MNFLEPYRINDININNIYYQKIEKTKMCKEVLIKYQDKKSLNKLVFQCPTLLNVFQPTKISDEYYELEIPLISLEKNKYKKIINLCDELDKKAINDAKSNARTWFENTSEIRYKKIIKECESYENGVLKLKIIKKPDFETIIKKEIQKNDNKMLSVNDIPTNSWCKMLLEIYSIQIKKNRFYYVFKPIMMLFKDKDIVNYNYNFVEDSDNDENDEINESEYNGQDVSLDDLFIKKSETNKVQDKSDLTSSNIQFTDTHKLQYLLQQTNQLNTSDSDTSFSQLTSSDKIQLSNSSQERRFLNSDDNTSVLE
jgi:hypothetical protein